MLARVSPSRVAVPCDVDHWKFFRHAASLVSACTKFFLDMRCAKSARNANFSTRCFCWKFRTRRAKVDAQKLSLNIVPFHVVTVLWSPTAAEFLQHGQWGTCHLPNACPGFETRTPPPTAR